MEPTDIRVISFGGAIEIRWVDGLRTELSARLLRASCRSAPARRLRLEGCEPKPVADIAIIGFEPVGRYAVNLVFSDGHRRGIYPWSYLRELAGLSAGNA
jgi:DUF971 family protein